MAAVKRLAGAYLVLVGTGVAVYFIINVFLLDSVILLDSIDVPTVWLVFDVLMAIGLGLALIFNYAWKRDESERDLDGSVTRRYLESTIVFYLTVVVTILFLHNWLSLLALGTDSLYNNDPAWIIWAFVDTMLPITFGVTGCRLWSEAGR